MTGQVIVALLAGPEREAFRDPVKSPINLSQVPFNNDALGLFVYIGVD